jgi:hypothetical protein
MRLRLILAACALCALLPLGSEASACFINYPVEIGNSNRTEAHRERDREARERREARALLVTRTAQARTAMAQGYDIVGALAEMLVPNIRPVPIVVPQSCEPWNEIDLADGNETIADLLAGSKFAGWASRYHDFAPPWQGETVGPACNAEFRGRFAALLRRRMTEPQLRAAYLFLAARAWNWKGNPVPLQNAGHLDLDDLTLSRVTISRLVAFEGRTRRPPIRWTPDSSRHQDIIRWTRRDPSGRALQAAMDAFWQEHGAVLSESERVCPAATARWPSVQAQIVAPLESWPARYPNSPPPR